MRYSCPAIMFLADCSGKMARRHTPHLRNQRALPAYSLHQYHGNLSPAGMAVIGRAELVSELGFHSVRVEGEP